MKTEHKEIQTNDPGWLLIERIQFDFKKWRQYNHATFWVTPKLLSVLEYLLRGEKRPHNNRI